MTRPRWAARSSMHIAIPVFAAVAVAYLGACSDRKTTTTTPATTTTAPASTPAASTSTPTSSAPVIAPGTAEDVTKKGTSTGMIGGEAGTVASSGKPGTGTESGAGTGAAQESASKTTDKK